MSLMKRLIFNNRITGIQLVKFSLIGLLNTGIHYSIFLFLYRVFGVYYLAASVVGYCAGLINSYIMNKKWTFRTTGVRVHIEFVKFIMVNLISLFVNLAALKYAVDHIGIIPEVGQIIAIVFSTIVNFLGNKLWTFHQMNKRSYPARLM